MHYILKNYIFQKVWELQYITYKHVTIIFNWASRLFMFNTFYELFKPAYNSNLCHYPHCVIVSGKNIVSSPLDWLLRRVCVSHNIHGKVKGLLTTYHLFALSVQHMGLGVWTQVLRLRESCLYLLSYLYLSLLQNLTKKTFNVNEW